MEAPKTRYVSAVASAGSSSTDVLWAYYSLAKARGVAGGRVAYKMNARGEHVVALILSGFERQ